MRKIKQRNVPSHGETIGINSLCHHSSVYSRFPRLPRTVRILPLFPFFSLPIFIHILTSFLSQRYIPLFIRLFFLSLTFRLYIPDFYLEHHHYQTKGGDSDANSRTNRTQFLLRHGSDSKLRFGSTLLPMKL